MYVVACKTESVIVTDHELSVGVSRWLTNFVQMSIEKASLLTDKDVVTMDKVELQQQLIRVEQEKQDLVSEKAGILSCSSYHC